MPAALVAKLAETTDIDIAEAEKRWNQAKAITTEEKGLTDKDGDAFWQYVTGVFKRSMGIGAVMEAADPRPLVERSRVRECPTSYGTCPTCGSSNVYGTRGMTSDRGCSDCHACWHYLDGEQVMGQTRDLYRVFWKDAEGRAWVFESATSEEIHTAAHEAATSHLNDLPQPTQAQLEAGNYRKGRIRLHGLDIVIENPKGSTRSGVDPDGKEWSVEMPYIYGYFSRTMAKDGDHVDCIIGDHPESELVFAVDQVDAETQKYDEPKIVLATRNLKEARDLYVSGFSDGKGGKRLGAITPMHVSGLKTWFEGDTTKPLSDAVLESAGDWRAMLLAADSFDGIKAVFAGIWPVLVKPASNNDVEVIKSAPFDSLDPAQQQLILNEVERQMQAVVLSKDAQGNLLSPTGKISKLNEHLYRAVRTPWFKEWAGDWEKDKENATKVLDPETGEPMPTFHGTTADYNEYDFSKTGENTKHPTAQLGMFLTNDPSIPDLFMAAKYNSEAERRAIAAQNKVVREMAQLAGYESVFHMEPHSPERKAIHDAGAAAFKANNFANGSNILPLFASIKKPLVLTWDEWFKAADWVAGTSEDGMAAIRDKIQTGAHDGIVLKAQLDRSREYHGDTFIVFRGQQVKSTIGNVGTFSADKSNITESATSSHFSP